MKKTLQVFTWLFVILSVTSAALHAQTVTVSGTVTDNEGGEALPGVTVLEKGTTNGTPTDVDGKYTINVEANSTLLFSFVGFTYSRGPNKRQIAIRCGFSYGCHCIR